MNSSGKWNGKCFSLCRGSPKAHSSPHFINTGINKLNKIHRNRNPTKWPNLRFTFFCSVTIIIILCAVLFDAGSWRMLLLLYVYNYCCSWHDFICFHTSVYLVNAGRMFSKELLIFQRMTFFFSITRFAVVNFKRNLILRASMESGPKNQETNDWFHTSTTNYFQLCLV